MGEVVDVPGGVRARADEEAFVGGEAGAGHVGGGGGLAVDKEGDARTVVDTGQMVPLVDAQFFGSLGADGRFDVGVGPLVNGAVVGLHAEARGAGNVEGEAADLEVGEDGAIFVVDGFDPGFDGEGAVGQCDASVFNFQARGLAVENKPAVGGGGGPTGRQRCLGPQAAVRHG